MAIVHLGPAHSRPHAFTAALPDPGTARSVSAPCIPPPSRCCSLPRSAEGLSAALSYGSPRKKNMSANPRGAGKQLPSKKLGGGQHTTFKTSQEKEIFIDACKSVVRWTRKKKASKFPSSAKLFLSSGGLRSHASGCRAWAALPKESPRGSVTEQDRATVLSPPACAALRSNHSSPFPRWLR